MSQKTDVDMADKTGVRYSSLLLRDVPSCARRLPPQRDITTETKMIITFLIIKIELTKTRMLDVPVLTN